jgi:hypothetical protein
MSLSHPGGCEQSFRNFHLRFTMQASRCRPSALESSPNLSRKCAAKGRRRPFKIATFPLQARSISMMSRFVCRGIPFFGIVLVGCALALAQAPGASTSLDPSNAQPSAARAGLSQAILEWTPPALTELGGQAVAKENFTLDRTMLAAAAGLLPDSDADLRQTVAKLDGVSVHMLRFSAEGQADPSEVEAIRAAYHLRGWKHVLSSTNLGGPSHSDITDVWLVMDGGDVQGGVVLVESPKSLTLATIAGDLSPIDMLHLQGHFGIPRYDSGASGGGSH